MACNLIDKLIASKRKFYLLHCLQLKQPSLEVAPTISHNI